MYSRRDLIRFYIGLAIPPLLCAAFILFSELVLVRAGEYMSLPEIRKKIERTGGVYSSALDARLFWFKQEIYRNVKPDIATLGSSRVLQFRKQFFSRSFVNLGNMHNLDDVTEMARSMFALHVPKVLLLGVDFWWFSPVYDNLEYGRSPKDAVVRSSDFFQMAGWIMSGKLSPRVIGEILRQSSPNVGVQGITTHQGIDASGAFIHSALVFGTIPHYDLKFRDTLHKIARGAKMFAYSQHPDPEKLEKLDRLFDYLQTLGMHVIVVVPPMAPMAVDAMAGHQADYAYIPEALAYLQKRAREHNFRYFSFHDPRLYGSSDCEMLDGFHGGPVAYARMLKEISLKDLTISAFLDLQNIEDSISIHAGQGSLFGSGEVDFLQIGCQK